MMWSNHWQTVWTKWLPAQPLPDDSKLNIQTQIKGLMHHQLNRLNTPVVSYK